MENRSIALDSDRRYCRFAVRDLASGARAPAELPSEERSERFPMGGLPRPVVLQVFGDVMRSRQLPATKMPDDGVEVMALVRARRLVLRDAREADVEGIVRVVLRAVLERNGEVALALAHLAHARVIERKLLVIPCIALGGDGDHVAEEGELLPEPGAAVHASENGLHQRVRSRRDVPARPGLPLVLSFQDAVERPHPVAEPVDEPAGGPLPVADLHESAREEEIGNIAR